MKEKNKSYKIAIILMVVGLILTVSGAFAWLSITLKGNKSNDIVVGNLSVKIGESLSEGIKIENALPMNDADGEEQDAYTFSITNDGNIVSNYTIYLDDKDIPDTETRMIDNDVKFSLIKNGTASTPRLLSKIHDDKGLRVLDSGTIEAGETYNYELRFWISDKAGNEVMSTLFSTNIRVEAEQIKE